MDDSIRIAALETKVTELERKLNYVMDHLRLDYADPTPAPAMLEVRDWLRKGNKIEAIKAYRLATGVGLAEAKHAVEAMEKTTGRY